LFFGFIIHKIKLKLINVITKKGGQHKNAPPKPLVYLDTNIIKTPQLFTLRRTYEQEKTT